MTVTHAKTDNITNWTQADLNAQIALGNFPVGTVLNDIVLPSDWNASHVVSIGTTDLVAAAVTYAKIQNASATTILGNPTGSPAAPSEITLGAGLSFSGTTLIASANFQKVPIGFTISNASGISTGKVSGFFVALYAANITGYDIIVDAGTATIQTWKIATGTAKPTVANSISTAGVSLSTGTALHSTTTSDFTSTSVAQFDIFAFNISAISGVTELTFQLELTKT